MDWLSEHWLLGVLLLAYTGALFTNAFIGSRASKGMSGYYVGARNLGGIAIGVSFFATFASTNSYIGHAGKAYQYGLPWLLMAVFLVVFTYVSWRWIGPRVRRFASHWDALTIPDFLGSRFVGEDNDKHLVRVGAAIVRTLRAALRKRPRRGGRSVYGDGTAGERMADQLATSDISGESRRKRIRY